MFRSYPGVTRSDHPARSVAALGKHSKYLTENHDLSNIFGEGSPIGKLYELDGEDFIEIGKEFEKDCPVKEAVLREAKLKMMSQRRLVDFATEWITKNRK